MAKKFEVTCIQSAYLPQYTLQTSSFSVPLPEEFESREKAEEYVKTVEQKWPTVLCSIREVEVSAQDVSS
jgi:hypothetical protein